jgi:hypothetical protein
MTVSGLRVLMSLSVDWYGDRMKTTRSTIKTIETMLDEMERDFPVDRRGAEEGQEGRSDWWTMMDDDIKNYNVRGSRRDLNG